MALYEGSLYEKLENGRVRCFSCGHRCVIPEGRAGICLVRYNEGGVLHVPHGYVGALQLDPVEKKPFFHAYPGSLAMSFGMLGCDYHCLTGETRVVTQKGPYPIEELFSSQKRISTDNRGTLIAEAEGLNVYTHLGFLKPVRKLFKHPYQGTLIHIQPPYLPAIDLTPEHPLLVVQKGGVGKGQFIPAGSVTKEHCLVIPKHFSFSEETVYKSREILSPYLQPIRHKRLISPQMIQSILDLTEERYSSKQIGFLINKDSSHVRHLRSKIKRGAWDLDNLYTKPGYLVSENGRVRFAKEHAPGIPEEIRLDEELAELCGYYVAEGANIAHRNRVQSSELVFTVGHHEKKLALRIQRLLKSKFQVEASLSKRETALCVSITKASLAKFFESLCGKGARNKRIPEALFNAPKILVEKFLDAYVEGDGHVYKDGKVSVTTVSRNLAFGILWLALKTGRFPSLKEYKNQKQREILGRTVRLSPATYILHWFPDNSRRRWLRQDTENYYVPIKSIQRRTFTGSVYNMEVEGDHSYLAQFLSTHNCGYCQNFLTSQSLRDPIATGKPTEMTAKQFVALAKSKKARIVTSTYNEPLITSEWAVEIFKEAKEARLITSYVSNGNGTPEVLEYIRPWVDLYKVDLKGFQDKHYRELGGVLSVVLETIGRLYEMGFWLEIVTLVIPGFNDSDEELRGIAKFLAGISKEIPWHVTAFHKDYKMRDRDNTNVATLIRAYEIGKEAGLHYVYPGNLPGQVGTRENTYCPSCNELLIERRGYTILQYLLKPGGHCPKCRLKIPGRWDSSS